MFEAFDTFTYSPTIFFSEYTYLDAYFGID